MRFKATAVAVLLLGLLAASETIATPDAGPTKAEKPLLAKVVEEWVTLGKWCVEKKLGAQAKVVAARAVAADPAGEGVTALKDAAAACEAGGADADAKECEKKLQASGKKAGGLYEKLVAAASADQDPRAQDRVESYVLAAAEADGNDAKRWAQVAAQADASIGRGDVARGARLAFRALALKPPEKSALKLKAVADGVATSNQVLMGASTHPLKYYLSLPGSFARTKGKKWPVLITVDGAGSGFQETGLNYRGARKGLNLIVVAPCTFGNTNNVSGDPGMTAKYRKWYTDDEIKAGSLDWDEAGILAVLADLQLAYDAEPRVYMTGFSGGGNATYMMTFKHPDLMNGAAPACGNFTASGMAMGMKGQFKPEDLNFPVHMITGEKDEHREFIRGDRSQPGIEPETDAAQTCLKELGYPNVKRTMVPGMGHGAAVEQVMATFTPYIEGSKKRGDKQN